MKTSRLAGMLLLAAGGGVLLAGCSLAPRYEAPAVTTPEGWKEAGEWLTAAPADTAPRGAWWQVFGDAGLDDLQARLTLQNAELAGAVARHAQARAIARGATSALLPQVTAGASAERRRTSANAPTSGGVARLGEDYVAGADFAWELDLFGRLRNERTAARDRAQASAADLAAVELALRAELASDYFQLRGADATLALLEDSVRLYERALGLTRNRYEGGAAAATDVDQARTQLESTRAQRAAVRLARSRLEHAIAVLIGEPAAQFTLAPAALADEPPAVAPLLPSALLQRRPDVAAAEREVAAANAGIGAARAAFFPVFSLGAGGGYEATTTPAWFEAPSRYWSVGPAAGLTLLDFGGRGARTRQARAAHEEAVARYRQTVLVAWREVEDELATLHHVGDELAADEAASRSARSSAAHADRRYEAGIADYLEVTSTQSAALQAQRSALDARVRRLGATVALLRALGGDWRAEAGGARTAAVSP
jgi:NodT family efflux transporter outer membrane factor (OMF) lipoprotein